MEPLGGIEPPTFALPRRRYTPKPQWRRVWHLWTRFNRYDSERLFHQQTQVENVARRARAEIA